MINKSDHVYNVTPDSAMPDFSCIVTRRLVESVGGVFDPVVSSLDWQLQLHLCTSKTSSQYIVCS